MTIHVRIDDLSSPESQALVSEHVANMHSITPACYAHALAYDALRRPGIVFWTAWLDEALCGCGALKELHAKAGEIKSMRTKSSYLRRGVAQAVLEEILHKAKERNYSHLYLETGAGPEFAAAHALYLKNGFNWCDAFGDYVSTGFNVFLAKDLTGELVVT